MEKKKTVTYIKTITRSQVEELWGLRLNRSLMIFIQTRKDGKVYRSMNPILWFHYMLDAEDRTFIVQGNFDEDSDF